MFDKKKNKYNLQVICKIKLLWKKLGISYTEKDISELEKLDDLELWERKMDLEIKLSEKEKNE